MDDSIRFVDAGGTVRELARCGECYPHPGSGHVVSHSETCHSDYCAMAGGIDDCAPVVEVCDWCGGTGWLEVKR